jgi:bifunctional non-homologous end joining protein LigD
MPERTTTAVEVEGRRLTLSNLEKVLYPEAGFTKAQLIDYYVHVAPILLPHLRRRPLTMKRYPEGVDGEMFYQKNCPDHRPPWVKTARVWSEGNKRWMDYCMVQEVATLVWAANLADIELHTSLSLAKEILQPTMIVFDLDPGQPANIVQCCQTAIWVRDIFQHFRLQAFPKTSGSKGLQVYVPLNTPVTYDDTKPFAHEVARMLEAQHPGQIVSDMKKALRVGKVLVDWSQNDDHKTTVCVYSLRAKSRPTVSTPVTWKEAEQCWAKKDASLLVFESDQVLKRVERMGDLFEPVLTLKQKLPPLEALGALRDGGEIGVQLAKSMPATKAREMQRGVTARPAARRRKV